VRRTWTPQKLRSTVEKLLKIFGTRPFRFIDAKRRIPELTKYVLRKLHELKYIRRVRFGVYVVNVLRFYWTRPRSSITRELVLLYSILEIAKNSGSIWRIYRCLRMLGLEISHTTVYNKINELQELNLIKTQAAIDNDVKREIFIELTNKGRQLLHSLKQIFSY